jgi:hypothetical protein
MRTALSVVVFMMAIFAQTVYAADIPIAKLKMQLTGATQDNAYFLCVSNNGCSNISAAAKGKIYMMDTGNVSYIFAANMKNLTMHAQALPASCQVDVGNEQTLVVSGKLLVKNSSPYIDNLKCTVK